jgi:hypothetical protein
LSNDVEILNTYAAARRKADAGVQMPDLAREFGELRSTPNLSQEMRRALDGALRYLAERIAAPAEPGKAAPEAAPPAP